MVVSYGSVSSVEPTERQRRRGSIKLSMLSVVAVAVLGMVALSAIILVSSWNDISLAAAW
jgi:hypothetical protein